MDRLEKPLGTRHRGGRPPGCRRPSRRCSGRDRHRTAACGRARQAAPGPTGRRPRAMTLTSRPGQALLEDDPRRPGRLGRARPRLGQQGDEVGLGAGRVVAQRRRPCRRRGRRPSRRGRCRPRRAPRRTPGRHRARRPRTSGCGPSGRRPPRRSRGRTPCSSRSGRRPRSVRRRGSTAATRASATPAASGASGPTTTSSADIARAAPTTASGTRASTSRRTTTRGSAPIATLPGATATWLTPGSADSFQASACSRPPPPTMRIRVGMIGWLMGGSSRAVASRTGRRRLRPGPGDDRRSGHGRSMAHRSVGALDRLGPLRSDRDEHDRHAGGLLESGHVAPGVLGQLGQRPGGVDRIGPAGEPLVDGRRPGERPRRSTASCPPAGRRSRTRRTGGSRRSRTGCRSC